ncbi:hypothetical protein C0993_009041 [Termitomyces sp. T159_Od127]|nr:hypothetical protein C0993_009041 [Termitomyces sp. T159_Od127]
MHEDDAHNASESSHTTAAPEGNVLDELEALCIQAEACDKLVDETVNGIKSYDNFADGIKALGYTPEEASDFFDAVHQRIEIRYAKSKATPISPKEATPEGLTGAELEAFHQERSATVSENIHEWDHTHNQAVEATAWAVLQAKLDQIAAPKDHSIVSPDCLINLLCAPKTPEPTTIPQSLLFAAPHLVQLQTKASSDPHVAQTWEL